MSKTVKMLPRYRVPVVENKRSNKKKTHEEYVEELKIKNPNIIPLENYVRRDLKIKHKCLIHDIVWEITPGNALYGKGCKECQKEKISHKKKKSHDEYVLELLEKNIMMKPLEKYINDRTKIKHLCLIHNIEVYSTPNNALHGKGCFECGKEKFSKSKRKQHSKYIIELESYNPHLSPLEEYNGANTPILHICKCGHVFKMTPSVAINGGLCPSNNSISRGEQKIEEYLNSNNLMYYKYQKYDDLIGINGGLLSYDFYLPKYNLLIEFQGEQHEKPVEHFGGEEKFKKQQEHDKRKREYAKTHNINLLEIWYYDIDNIETILTEYLNNLKLESVTTTGVA